MERVMGINLFFGFFIFLVWFFGTRRLTFKKKRKKKITNIILLGIAMMTFLLSFAGALSFSFHIFFDQIFFNKSFCGFSSAQK
jgi:hypothetical protein